MVGIQAISAKLDLHRSRDSEHSNGQLVALAVFSFSSSFHLTVVGDLYLSEIFAGLLVPLLIINQIRSGRPLQMAAQFMWASLFSTAIMFLSAYYAASIDAEIKAIANYVAFFLLLFVLGNLLDGMTSLRIVLLFLAAGMVVQTVLQPSTYFHDYPWKFGLAIPVTALLVLLADRQENQGIRLVILLLCVGMNLIFDFRSLSLVSALVLAHELLGRRVEVSKRRRQSWKPLALIALSGYALAVAYSSLVESGLLGAGASLKLKLQGQGSPILMLLGGRYEGLFSIPAAIQNPLIGYGPSPTPPAWLWPQVAGILDNLNLVDLSRQVILSQQETIPTHSFIMQSWIEVGILGFIFWVLTIRDVSRGYIAFSAGNRSMLLVNFCFYFLLWNLLFSPFGGQNRFIVAFVIAFFASPRTPSATGGEK